MFLNDKSTKILQVSELASYLEGTNKLLSVQDVHMVHTPKRERKNHRNNKISSNVLFCN